MCQTKTAGRGGGVYVLVVLRGRVDDPGQTKQGEVCVLVFGGIDAPVRRERSFWQYKAYADIRGGSLERGRQMRVGS